MHGQKTNKKKGWGTTIRAGTRLEIKLRVVTIPPEGWKQTTRHVKVADLVSSWLGRTNRYTGDYVGLPHLFAQCG